MERSRESDKLDAAVERALSLPPSIADLNASEVGGWRRKTRARRKLYDEIKKIYKARKRVAGKNTTETRPDM